MATLDSVNTPYISRSGSTIITKTFSGSAPYSFLDNIKQLFQLQGSWTITGITNGYRFYTLGLQNIPLTLDIYSITSNRVAFKFGNFQQGYEHPIKCNGDWTYQAIIGQCQVFISVVGIATAAGGTNFCGGTPCLPLPSMPYAHGIEECWWAMGDGYSPNQFISLKSLRTSFTDNSIFGTNFGTAEAQYQSDACLRTGIGENVGTPQILGITGPSFVNFLEYLHQTRSHTYLYDNSGITYPAIVAWGNTQLAIPKLRGVLWDAFVYSKPEIMDTIMIIDGNGWMNYTHEFYYGSVYLLIGAGSLATSNYAY